MPSATGYVTEEQLEQIEELVEAGKYDDVSDFIQFSTQYTLDRKHDN